MVFITHLYLGLVEIRFSFKRLTSYLEAEGETPRRQLRRYVGQVDVDSLQGESSIEGFLSTTT